MFKNYLISALRNIRNQKVYALINITGLSVGLAATILIMLWVFHVLSFNRKNEHFRDIYRVVQTQMYQSGPLTTPCMPGPLAADLRKDFPEIVDIFRFYDIPGVVSYGEKRFAENVQMADSGLFSVFSFDFLKGSPENALKPFTTILSESGAKKYFGDEDPMNKIIRLDNKISFTINGIIKDPPENSSFDKEIFLPFEHLKDLGWTLDRYGWNTYFIYVQLPPETDYHKVSAKIKDYFKVVRDDETGQVELFLYPLQQEQLYSYTGKPELIIIVWTLSIIALFILLIACINFMNLSTARASKRSREIGLRKVVGARRGQLIYQFLSESVLMAIVAMVVAMLLVNLFLPLFNQLTGTELALDLLDVKTLLILPAITIFTGIIAGSYPALYLSALKPLKSIRKSSGAMNGNPWFRRSLVVFQFVLSIGLIISTIVIYSQISYIRNKNLGMNKENVVYAQLREDITKNFPDFKNRILQNPDVLNVTRSSHLPFRVGSNSGGLTWDGKTGDEDVLIGIQHCDRDFIETMQMQMVEGRFFETGYSTDTAAVVINETAVKTLGMENPVGKWIGWNEGKIKFNIIGVIKDFHFLRLNSQIEPLAMFYNPDNSNFALIRVNGSHTKEAVAHIEKTWNEFAPAFPFEYNFLDESYERMYRNETRLGSIIKYFSILAVIISCLGLFGLASFMTEQRTKEIGIRKVLGASMQKIILMQQREFMLLVAVANLIAWPLAWKLMKGWLDGYAFKISLSPLFFILAGFLSLAITFFTILFLAWRAANKNPVDAIKYE